MAFLIEPLHGGVLPDTITQGTLLSSFLASPVLETIAETIECEYYDQNTPRQHYPAVVMLKLLVIKCFRKLSYARTIQTLTEEDCNNPGGSLEEPLPRPATLHHFVKYRLGVDGLNRIMTLVGTALVHLCSAERVGIVDSTPLEASRYDPNAPYNPHYQIRMDKAHIFHLGRYPLGMVCSLVHRFQNNRPYLAFIPPQSAPLRPPTRPRFTRVAYPYASPATPTPPALRAPPPPPPGGEGSAWGYPGSAKQER